MNIFLKSFIVFVIQLSTSMAVCQLNKTKNALTGTIVFNNNKVLNCSFVYDPKRPDLLQVNYPDHQEILKPSMIKSFSFWDDETNMKRFFITMLITEKQITKSYFLESHFNDTLISILGRDTEKVNRTKRIFELKQGAITDNNDSTTFSTHLKYLLDNRNNTLYPLSKEAILRLTQDRKDEIKNFIKENKLHLKNERIEDFIIVIDHYKRLKVIH